MQQHDAMQESLALLQMLARSAADVEAGRLRDSDDVFANLRSMITRKQEETKTQFTCTRTPNNPPTPP